LGIGTEFEHFGNVSMGSVQRDVTALQAADVAVVPVGAEHAVDTVIYGTGFHAADYLRSLDVYGTHGRRLRDDWREGAEAYLGTVVPGYPNLFTLYGPNTNGVTSIIYILEAQAEFVRRTLDEMALRGVQAIDIKRGTHDEYNADIQRAIQDTVWLANCNNYYRHPNGKVVTQFPYSGTKFVAMLAHVELDAFDQMEATPCQESTTLR
jgi:cation diffusion facilitator CzcD-associated flavoprotein CzcO